MSREEIKKELHKLIDETEDDNLLNLLREELVTYGKQHSAKFDDLSYLSPEDRAELEKLANEDPEKDTISVEEFQKNIAGWHSELLLRRDSKTK